MYGGFPPVSYKDFIKNQTSTASLYEMRRNLNKVLKKINVEK
jgi:UDP-3-O-[3-hydroxymyristoyl] glucosamine N-acyltransferase